MSEDDIKALTLVVKSPAGNLYERPGLRSVQLELRDGKIGIRTGHAPIIAEVIDGEAVLYDGDSIDRMSLRAGIVYVKEDVVSIYTHSLDPNSSTLGKRIDHDEEEFDDLYEAIVAKLLSGPPTIENQHVD